MSKEKPLVSVVMPAYNAEKYISEAIESILNQTFRDFEFIIIDDGSKDKTWEIIQDYAKNDNRVIPVKNEENLKICKTLNKGILMSRGEYIVRMDSDDWSYPERIEKQVSYMTSHPDVVISGGNIEVCDEGLDVIHNREYPSDDADIRKVFFRYNPFCHPSTIYKSDIAKEIGLYNPTLYDAEDYDIYFRFGNVGKLANIKDVIHKLRTRSDSVSQSRTKSQEMITLYIRHKAVVEYGYKPTTKDKIYNVLQVFIGFLIPSKIKFRLFSYLRSKKII